MAALDPPVVSIIMPTKGRVELVRRAVRSVLAQTVDAYELWILDDSPKEEALQIAQFSDYDPRIEYVDREGIGVSEARALGVHKARGEYLSFLDSDDYWASRRLERHLDVWVDNKIGLSWDSCQEVGGPPKLEAQPFAEGLVAPPRVARKLYLGNFIHASSGFTKTEYARKIDFSWSILSDWVIFMRLSESLPAFFIDEPLSYRTVELTDSVSKAHSSQFFFREALRVRRRVLLSRPGVYFPVWMERSWSKLKRKLGLENDSRQNLLQADGRAVRDQPNASENFVRIEDRRHESPGRSSRDGISWRRRTAVL